MASELFNKGIKIRREVLGADYVDKSMNNVDEFSMAMQEYATETAWGMIWSRPGLPHKTRSLLNVGLTTALRCSHETKVHIRGALINGATREEIRAVLMQVMMYAGILAVREAVRGANQVFERVQMLSVIAVASTTCRWMKPVPFASRSL